MYTCMSMDICTINTVLPRGFVCVYFHCHQHIDITKCSFKEVVQNFSISSNCYFSEENGIDNDADVFTGKGGIEFNKATDSSITIVISA